MSEEILKDLSRVIEKHKDKVFCTGELNYVDMAKSCKLEIERLNKEKENLTNIVANRIIKDYDIETPLKDELNKSRLKNIGLESQVNRLNNIINELEKWAEGYIFADIFKDKIKELKGDGSNENE